MKYHITALGELLIDFTPMGTDDSGDVVFARKAGGAPLNLLATVSAFGGRTAYIGKVGDDMFGRFLRETVQACGIDAGGLSIDPVHNTTMAFIQLDEKGDRDFAFCRRFGADTFLSVADVPADMIRQSAIFHFGSLSFTAPGAAEATRYALSVARAAGCLISYDPNDRPPLWESRATAVAVMRENLTWAHMVKASREEVLMVTDQEDVDAAMDAIHRMGVRLIVVTDGPRPIRLSLDGRKATVIPTPRKAKDTTGAGDIFFGSLLSCLLHDGIDTPAGLDHLTVPDVVRYVTEAADTAGRSTLRHGAIASIPVIPEAWRIST